MIVFEVPGTPVAKGRPRASTLHGHVRLLTPEKTQRYEARVALFGAQAMNGREPFGGAVGVMLRVYFDPPKSWPKKRLAANADKPEWVVKRPDADNLAKAVCDALNGICWADDAQVADLRVLKLYGPARLEVVVGGVDEL